MPAEGGNVDRMRVDWVSRSDKGRVRQQNEDSLFSRPDSEFAILCDGMGGHLAGEVASRIAVESFCQAMGGGPDPSRRPAGSPVPDEVEILVASAAFANETVHTASMADARHKGMGCTLVALRLREGRATFVSIGDSRLYLLRDGVIGQITEDHTRIRMLRKMGVRLSPASEMQIKGVITRAVGTHPTVEIDYGAGPSFTGDTWLLCSDGLTDEVPDESIRDVLVRSKGIAEGADRLIEIALAAGGRDNITLAIAKVIESPADRADGEDIPVPLTFEPTEGPSDEELSPEE